MKKCSDCTHFSVCENRYSWLDQEDNTKYIVCQHFKDSLDVVEVVRCGECIHSKERKIKDTVICSKYNAYKDINGFCEAGEKKKDGE